MPPLLAVSSNALVKIVACFLILVAEHHLEHFYHVFEVWKEAQCVQMESINPQKLNLILT